jgi:hypothetical protein
MRSLNEIATTNNQAAYDQAKKDFKPAEISFDELMLDLEKIAEQRIIAKNLAKNSK